MILCVLLPRFELVVAAGGRRELLGRPVALAPESGRTPAIGEVSPAAERYGVRAGIPLGEALTRCPELTLLPADPAGTADMRERVLRRLEALGAAVEPGVRPGEACLDAAPLRRLHGGQIDGVVAAVRGALPTARVGLGPTRFCAIVAAHAARRQTRRGVVSGAADLAPHPVRLLDRHAQTAALPDTLERLGIGTLGQLAALPRGALGERFGPAGLLAQDLARGRDAPLRPRRPEDALQETLLLPEAGSGEQLGRALALLVDRLLARRERDGRTLRALTLSARLVESGTWRERVVLRRATADPERLRLAAGARLALLPAPAEALRLRVERFGPAHAAGEALFDDGRSHRRGRLREAVAQARAAAGPDAALRVLTVDPDSRVPERRTILTPFEG